MFLLFLFSLGLSFTWASEGENIFLQACFRSSAEATNALQKLSFIQASIDKLQQDDKCVDIMVLQRRRNLYESFLQQKFQGQYVLTDQVIANNKQCHIEVIKISQKNLERLRTKLGNNLQLHQTDLASNANEVSSLVISNGQSGSIRHHDSVTKVECQHTSKGLNLKIFSESQSNSISSSYFVAFGNTIEIGSISQKNNDKNNGISISSGWNKQTSERSEEVKIFLRARP